MRQAITTKYLGPTNSKGSRIKAIARKRDSMGPEMSHTEPCQYRGTEQEHCAAAKACAEKYGWSGVWFGGGSADEDGYVFVNLGRADPLLIDPLTRRGTEGADWFTVADHD